jgi:hypothetical protein
MELTLAVGDIVIDKISGEIGLLVERYLLTNKGPDDPIALWAWDVYWVGAKIIPEKRLTPWTEYGLTNIIKAGTFMHYRNI